jgi:hypothetical protein
MMLSQGGTRTSAASGAAPSERFSGRVAHAVASGRPGVSVAREQ